MREFYNQKINDVWKSLDDEGKEAMLLFGKQCADAAITGLERGYKRGFKQGVAAVFVAVTVGGMIYDWWKERGKSPENDDVVVEADFAE